MEFPPCEDACATCTSPLTDSEDSEEIKSNRAGVISERRSAGLILLKKGCKDATRFRAVLPGYVEIISPNVPISISRCHFTPLLAGRMSHEMCAGERRTGNASERQTIMRRVVVQRQFPDSIRDPRARHSHVNARRGRGGAAGGGNLCQSRVRFRQIKFSTVGNSCARYRSSFATPASSLTSEHGKNLLAPVYVPAIDFNHAQP